MRASVERAGLALRGAGGEGGEAQDAGTEDDDDEHGHLHLEGLDLLAQVLGRAADHEPGDEDRQDGAQDEHPVEAGADAAGRDLAELDEEEGHQAGDRLEAVVHRVHGAGAGPGRDGGPEGAGAGAEAGLLALHAAELLVDAGREQRVAARLAGHRDDGADDEHAGHGREDAPSPGAGRRPCGRTCRSGRTG